MKLSRQVGSTSQTINVFIQDSSSTTGAGLTGLAFNTASLVAYYALPRAAAVQISLVTLAAVTSAYSSGGFKEIDATNMPGWYRLDVPDAAFASGEFVDIHLKGASNMAPCPVEIELTAWNNQDAVRGGMTAFPNVNAGLANGLPLLDANLRVHAIGSVPKGVALSNYAYVLNDATTHQPKAGATSLAATIIKDNGSEVACTNAPTEISNGRYTINLTSTEMNANAVLLRFTASGCDPTNILILTSA